MACFLVVGPVLVAATAVTRPNFDAELASSVQALVIVHGCHADLLPDEIGGQFKSANASEGGRGEGVFLSYILARENELLCAMLAVARINADILALESGAGLRRQDSCHASRPTPTCILAPKVSTQPFVAGFLISPTARTIDFWFGTNISGYTVSKYLCRQSDGVGGWGPGGDGRLHDEFRPHQTI